MGLRLAGDPREHPDAPATLLRSIEVDVAPRNHPERVIQIDGALGLRPELRDRVVRWIQVTAAELG